MGPEGEYRIDIPSDDSRKPHDNLSHSLWEAESRARDYLAKVPRDEELPEVYIEGPDGRKLFNPKR